MHVDFDIRYNLKDAFAKSTQVTKRGESYFLDEAVAKNGEMTFHIFSPNIEFYHFKKTQFQEPIYMKSINPPDTDWFVVHINLSRQQQQKSVGERQIEFQKYLPMGVLVYGPGLEIDTVLPPHVDTEVCTVRFSKAFLESYFPDNKNKVSIEQDLLYEDLDINMERLLMRALNAMDNKLLCHGLILEFMHLILQKLKIHDKSKDFKQLHAEDMRFIFKAATVLRNPLAESIPSLKELAATANMGVTKFKTLFKQVFGKPPYQYHLKIRMEFAREQIVYHKVNPTEISYTLGYAHPSNFTEAYKKHFGELPSSYQ